MISLELFIEKSSSDARPGGAGEATAVPFLYYAAETHVYKGKRTAAMPHPGLSCHFSPFTFYIEAT
jgi:hypothetical protein